MQSLQIKTVPIDQLDPNTYNPNSMSDAVFNDLTQDVIEGDMDQPVIVREKEGGRFEIIDGEHRWRSSVAAGKTDILISLKTVTDDEAKVMTVRRNVLRGELDRSKFTALVQSLSSKGQQVEQVRKAMGLSERDFARSFLGQTQQTKDVSAVLTMAEKNMSVSMLVANLSQMVREIVQANGDTVQSGYLCFAFKGHVNLLISCDSDLAKAVQEFTQVAKQDGLTQKQLSARLADALKAALD